MNLDIPVFTYYDLLRRYVVNIGKYVSILVAVTVALVSCANPIDRPATSSGDSTVDRILTLRDGGFFNKVRDLKSAARSVDNEVLPSHEDQQKLIAVVENPGEVVSAIRQDLEGEAQIALVDTILSDDATAQDVSDKMRALDPALADSYDKAMADNLNLVVASSGRSLGASNLALSDIKLRHTLPSGSSRGFLVSNTDWDTILIHLGFAATTTAGLAIYKWTPEWVWAGWFPSWNGWVRWVGLGIAAGSASLMATQVALWCYNTPEYKDWISTMVAIRDTFNEIKDQSTQDGFVAKVKTSLSRQNLYSTKGQDVIVKVIYDIYKPYVTLQDLLSTFTTRYFADGLGVKTAVWVGGTAVPVTFAAVFTPEVFGWMFDAVKAPWNWLMSRIAGLVPGVNLNINLFGLPLKPL